MKKSISIICGLLIATVMNVHAQKKPVRFIIETDLGNIEGYLYDETPLHRDNFVKLVKEGWYNGSEFHRVIKNFMIQGGHNADGRVDPGYTIPAEIKPGFFHKKGALSAARMGDQVNPEKASSGCQFYIVQGNVYSDEMLQKMAENKTASKGNVDYYLMQILQKPENQQAFSNIQAKIQDGAYEEAQALIEPFMAEAQAMIGDVEPFAFTEEQVKAYTTIGGTPHLDDEYTVFGEITKGLDIVDKIAEVETGAADKPVKPVRMTIKLKK